MASRVSSKSSMWRDLPNAKLVLAWMALGISIIFYFSDWSPPWRIAIVVRPQISSPARNKISNDGEIYTGSILFTPRHGDQCLKRTFDNRTGEMRDNGSVACDVVAPREKTKNTTVGMAAMRMRAIGEALRHQKIESAHSP